MSVTVTQTRLSQYSVLITATPSVAGSTLYWYIDGNLVETTARTFKQIELRPGRAIQVEVLDDADAVPSPAYPDYALLTWDTVDDAANYRIDQWDGDSWETQATLSGQGRAYLEWESAALANGTHLFRVVPLRRDGTEGTPREWTITMVTASAASANSSTYDSGTKTITNAVA